MKLLVKPICGWGWTNALGDPVDVPDPFELDASVIPEDPLFKAAVGQLPSNNGHPLHGLWIRLSQRHTILDGNYNLVASDEELSLTETAAHRSSTFRAAGYAMAGIFRRPTPGETVMLTAVPPGLLADLPNEDQRAISEIVGKPIQLVDYDELDRAELKFTDSEGILHFVYVRSQFIRAVE